MVIICMPIVGGCVAMQTYSQYTTWDLVKDSDAVPILEGSDRIGAKTIMLEQERGWCGFSVGLLEPLAIPIRAPTCIVGKEVGYQDGIPKYIRRYSVQRRLYLCSPPFLCGEWHGG
jgi:hypothetical protein